MIALLGVIAGLVLVVWELQQTRELTHLQLVYSTLDEYAQERAAHYGENIGEVLERACSGPEDLSDAELFVLDAYFNAQVSRANRYKLQVDIAGYDADWRRLGTPPIKKVLSFPQGQWWLRQHPIWASDPEISGLIDKVIGESGLVSCREFVEEFREAGSALNKLR